MKLAILDGSSLNLVEKMSPNTLPIEWIWSSTAYVLRRPIRMNAGRSMFLRDIFWPIENRDLVTQGGGGHRLCSVAGAISRNVIVIGRLVRRFTITSERSHGRNSNVSIPDLRGTRNADSSNRGLPQQPSAQRDSSKTMRETKGHVKSRVAHFFL